MILKQIHYEQAHHSGRRYISIRKVDVTITDITGKIVYATTASGTQNIEVNTENFAEGVYVVQIQSPKGIEAQKFILAR